MIPGHIRRVQIALLLVPLATTTALATTSLSLLASPYQGPGLQGSIVVAVVANPADGLTSMDLSFRYDPARLTPAGAWRTALSNGSSLSYSTATPGVVSLRLASATPLSGSGECAWVVFKSAALAATTTPLTWVSAVLNGGAIPVQTTGTSVALHAATTISVPEALQSSPGAIVSVPISTGPLAGASAFDLAMSWNPAVLQATGAQKGALTSCMTLFYNLTQPGTIYISLYGGACSVSGSGQLAQVSFRILGAAGTATPLNITRGAVNEGHIETVLEDGLLKSCLALDTDGDGYSTCSGDCDDSNPAIHPGVAEACNGADDNCNGMVDETTILPLQTLMVRRQSAQTRISWTGGPGGRYDVVRGDLRVLLGTHGDFRPATAACLANDLAATEVVDASESPAGSATWYLARPLDCAGTGSYDGPSPPQAGPRDPGITASPYACP